MHFSDRIKFVLAGFSAGIINGLFGAGGGMILIPLLGLIEEIRDEEIFPSSVCIMLPICLVSLLCSTQDFGNVFIAALPYLSGSLLGGIASGVFGRKIPTLWLHRIFGIFILWGGIRYLC